MRSRTLVKRNAKKERKKERKKDVAASLQPFHLSWTNGIGDDVCNSTSPLLLSWAKGIVMTSYLLL